MYFTIRGQKGLNTITDAVSHHNALVLLQEDRCIPECKAKNIGRPIDSINPSFNIAILTKLEKTTREGFIPSWGMGLGIHAMNDGNGDDIAAMLYSILLRRQRSTHVGFFPIPE